MKTSIQICALLVTLTGLSAASAQPTPAAGPAVRMSMKCNLSRITWDEKANKRVVEDLTPASVKEQPVIINSIAGGEMKPATIQFSVATSDGQMDFFGSVFATEMFGKRITLSSHLGATIHAKDMTVNSDSSFPPDLDLADESIFLNATRIPGVHFGTGLKADATVSAVYVGGCDLKVSKK